MAYFVNTANNSMFVAADGKWLDTPQAALYGSTAQGNQTVVLLSLSNPLYNNETQVSSPGSVSSVMLLLVPLCVSNDPLRPSVTACMEGACLAVLCCCMPISTQAAFGIALLALQRASS